MATAIGLRSDYWADDLRRLAKASRDAKQTRRLLALAAIYDGVSRTDAARISGVGLQVVRDWVLRFNSSGPAGLIDRKPPGKAALLTAEQRSALADAELLAVVEDGGADGGGGFAQAYRLAQLFYQLRLPGTGAEGDQTCARAESSARCAQPPIYARR